MRSEKASISSVVVSPLPHSLAMSRNGALLMAAMGAKRQSSEISTEPIFMREPGSGPVDQIYTAREQIDLWVGFWQDQRSVSEVGFGSSVWLIRVAFIATLISLSSTPLLAAYLAGVASPAELVRGYSQALARQNTNAVLP